MRKQVILLLTALVFAWSLTACTPNRPQENPTEQAAMEDVIDTAETPDLD